MRLITRVNETKARSSRWAAQQGWATTFSKHACAHVKVFLVGLKPLVDLQHSTPNGGAVYLLRSTPNGGTAKQLTSQAIASSGSNTIVIEFKTRLRSSGCEPPQMGSQHAGRLRYREDKGKGQGDAKNFQELLKHAGEAVPQSRTAAMSFQQLRRRADET